MDRSPNRRRFLAASTAGVTALSGCIYTEDDDGDTPAGDGNQHTEESRDPRNRPEEPAIEFESGFNVTNAPEYADWNTDNYGGHRFTRSFAIDVSEDGTVHVETTEGIHIVREGSLTVGYQRSDGSVAETDSTTLSPTEGYDQHSWEFDVPDPDTLPRHRKATVKLLYRDSHQYYQGRTKTLKRHDFAIVPYSFESGGDGPFVEEGTHVVNDESLNWNFHDDTRDGRDRFYTEFTHDVSIGRLRVYVLTYGNPNDEFITGYSALPNERYQNYVGAAEPESGWWVTEGGWHPGTVIYNVEDHVHLTTLADSLATSLDENGFAQRWTRLQKLAHFVGCIDSHEGLEKAPPIRTLWLHTADCTEATSLFLALIHTETFGNTRGAMVACEWNGGAHAIVGIDERDIAAPNPADVKWHTPSQTRLELGVPDTRYALVELTQPRAIGDIDEQATDITAIMGTNGLHISSSLRNPPYGEKS